MISLLPRDGSSWCKCNSSHSGSGLLQAEPAPLFGCCPYRAVRPKLHPHDARHAFDDLSVRIVSETSAA